MAAQLSQEMLKFGHEVCIVALDHKTTAQNWFGVDVVPSMHNLPDSPADLYYWDEKFESDVILQLFDVWCIGRQWIENNRSPVIVYSPIDCHGMPHYFKESSKNASLLLGMSKHALKEFKKANLGKSQYLPHSIHTDLYQPLSKFQCRFKYKFPKKTLADDAFVIGLIGTNISERKNIPGQLLAFRMFLDRCPEANAYFYLQTVLTPFTSNGFDLKYVIEGLRLNDRVLIAPPAEVVNKIYDDSMMCEIYNCFDVLTQCSYGEGFGIPMVEAQSCGIPVIGSKCSAITEVIGDGGILVDRGVVKCVPDTNSWQFIADPMAVSEKYELLWRNSQLRGELSEKARINAQKYDWKIWSPVWNRTFEKVSMRGKHCW